MVIRNPLHPAAIVEDASKDTNVQAWLQEKHWELAAPCGEWNYWHLELGNGNILPVTPTLLMKMYQKDHSQA